jgi:hypothetical protein
MTSNSAMGNEHCLLAAKCATTISDKIHVFRSVVVVVVFAAAAAAASSSSVRRDGLSRFFRFNLISLILSFAAMFSSRLLPLSWPAQIAASVASL